MHSLTLYIPGLLFPSSGLMQDTLPSTPSLDSIFTYGRHTSLLPSTYTDALARLFNHKGSARQDFPVAAITRLVDEETDTDGIWMRADPVHLVADHAGLILEDNSSFSLDQHDALVLAADIATIFSELDMQLEAPTTQRWYLRMSKKPAIVTTPLHEVVGRDIDRFMPKGKDQAAWANIMNEVQMVFHNSEINLNRQRQGEKAVNSLWFWGCGKLPGASRCPWTRVFTDDVTCQGLARLSGIEGLELPDQPHDIIRQSSPQDRILAVISFGLRHCQYGDLPGWQDFIVYLDQFLFGEITEGIRSGRISELNLLTEERKIYVDKKSFRKFWRRHKPLNRYAR